MVRLDVDLFQDLVTFRATAPAAISCYLDLDAATVPTPHELDSHVTSLAGAVRRAAEEASDVVDHDATSQLRADVDRITSFLESRLDRSGARSLALFACGAEDRWVEVRVAGHVADAVYVGRTFVTAPLLEFAERDRDVVVVALSRDRGQIWQLHHGEMTALEDLTCDGQGRSGDREALEHMRRVAEALSRRIKPGSGTLLVVACTQELRDAFRLLMEPHVKQALIGFTELEKQDDVEGFVSAVGPLLDGRLAAEREALLEAWREAMGQREGFGAGTWDELLAAAWDGRIETILVDGRTAAAYECPSCGRGYRDPGRCALDSTGLIKALGGALELALRGTLVHGGTARFVPGDALRDTTGAVALLRYAATPAPRDVSARRP